MMKDDNEDDLKNKEDLHRWKAHGAGHIPLWGIFFKGSSHSRRLLFGIWTSYRSSNQMERLGLIWATYSPPPKSFLSISKTKSNQSLLKVKHFIPKSCLLFNKAIFNKKKLDPHLFCFIFYRYSRQQTPLTFVKWNEILEDGL